MSTFSFAQVQKTPGDVTLSFRTVTANGNYAPRHVLAVWVEDENGFVKSRLVRANNRKQYLYTWIAASSYNDTDAITGATLNSHQTHMIEWDCTDLDGQQVADGNYIINVEFTERHAQGPLYSIEFMKGDMEQHLTPLDQIYFKDIQLDYLPETTGVNPQNPEKEFKIYPNPGNGIFTIAQIPENTKEITILTTNGIELLRHDTRSISKMEYFTINLTRYQNGIYFLKCDIGDRIIMKKLIKK
jgi:hypothetical protein